MSDIINVTKKMIIDTAIDIIREQGDVVYVTLREIAKRLNISTKPMFDLYDSVEDIILDTKKAALNDLIEEIMKPSDKYSGTKKIGMLLVLFAKREPNLFKFIFMSTNDFIDKDGNPAKGFSELNIAIDFCVKKYMDDLGLSREMAQKLFNRIWFHTIALCNMCVMGIRAPTEEQCSVLLSQAYIGSLEMIKTELQGNTNSIKADF